MNDPVETSEIAAFARAVEARSLSRAATELGIPRATLGRRLARLEQRLGVRLLRRTTRSLALTDAGEAFYRHARVVLEAVSHAEQSVRRTDNAVRGMVRVSLPPRMDPRFGAMICAFAERYPDVRLHLHFSTQHVDLQRDGYDVALRAGAQLEPGLIARTLARDPIVAVAAPRYLAERGTPRSARELRGHRCLLGFARGEVPQTHWPLAGGGKVAVEGVLLTNQLELLRDAAVRGLGIALLPLRFAGADLEQGALVRVLPGVVEAETRIALVYREREFMPPAVRAFIDAVAAWATQSLEALAPLPRAAAARAPRARTVRRRASR